MSNPFSLFRKNQKVWIAGLTVAVMIGFGVLPVVMQMMGSGGPTGVESDPVVFSTNAGEVRQRELSGLRQQRGLINRFYEEVIEKTGRGNIRQVQLPTDVESIAGDYDLRPLTRQSEKLIYCATRRRKV